MVEWVKCIPFVGTAVSVYETGKAIYDGDDRKALRKLGESAIGLGMDAVTVASLGSDTPGKFAASGAAKTIAQATVVRGVSSTLISGKDDTSGVKMLRGSGGDDERDPFRRNKGAHEEDLTDHESPIKTVWLDSQGRVVELVANIYPKHRRSGRKSKGYTREVESYVETLGRLEGDHIGHIIGWGLGAPDRQIYNFFPQSGMSNWRSNGAFEARLRRYLDGRVGKGRRVPNDSRLVSVWVKLQYEGNSKRPTKINYVARLYPVYNKPKHRVLKFILNNDPAGDYTKESDDREQISSETNMEEYIENLTNDPSVDEPNEDVEEYASDST